MTNPRVTASMLTRVMNCPESVWLDQWDDSSDVAMRGTEIHKYLENVHHMGVEEALRHVTPEYVKDCKEIAVKDLPFDILDSGITTERRFVYDPIENEWSTGEHPEDNSCYSGQADVSYVDGDTAVVVDYKTGVKREKARHAWQIKFLCLAVARKYKLKKAQGMLIYTPGMDVCEVEFDEEELNIIEEQLRALPARIMAAKGSRNYRGGPWCRYCPGILSCPPITRAVNLAAGLEKDRRITNNMLPIISDAEKGLSAVKNRLSKLLYAISFKDVTVGDRRFYMDKRKGLPKLDELTVESVLLNHIPDEVSPRDFGEVKYTKTSIRRTCESYGIDAKAVLAELEESGGTTRELKNNPIEEHIKHGDTIGQRGGKE